MVLLLLFVYCLLLLLLFAIFCVIARTQYKYIARSVLCNAVLCVFSSPCNNLAWEERADCSTYNVFLMS